MSLFSSAFETGTVAGPSTSAMSGTGNKHKRKRPSHGPSPDHNSSDQLRAAQKNLEKLMKSVEAGGVDKKASTKTGGEAMGLPSAKRSKTGGSPAAGEGKGPARGMKGPSGPSPGNKQPREESNGSSKPGKLAKAQQADARSASSPAASEKKRKQKQPKEVNPAIQPSASKAKEAESAGLTKIQKGMKSKLEGARFRWINEQLYTTSSTDALAMMKKDPKIFADYHSSHRVQTAAWPSPPLPIIADRIRTLPRGSIIVDLGCGDAELAKTLAPAGYSVLSYDLVSDQDALGADGGQSSNTKGEGWVVQADFHTHVPLPGRPGGQSAEVAEKKGRSKAAKQEKGPEMVDAVVCCLSLMGINWVGGIHEACRILKQGGVFHVAEVTSRFVSQEKFVEVIESFGFELDNEESPSTHFTLFAFKKVAATPIGPVAGQQGWSERVKQGEEILQACVYKKR